MVNFHSKIYFDKEMQNDKKRESIRANVEARKITFPGTAGIFISVNEDNIAEIIPFNDMLLPAYAHVDHLCIGICASRESGEKLLTDLLADIYKEHGYISAGEVKSILLG